MTPEEIADSLRRSVEKKLWLQKKFVVETNCCITLDRVPEELYPEIVANDAQREEWVRLLAIDKIEKDLNGPGYSEPLTVGFLRVYPALMIETRSFDAGFVTRLCSLIESANLLHHGNLLLQSDNFHALSILSSRFGQGVHSIYIDPPCNTTATEFLYKNDCKHSSWLSFILSRLEIATSKTCAVATRHGRSASSKKSSDS